MNINNNRYLTEVDVNALGNVTRGLIFAANSKDLKISLPNLESAANLTFIEVSDVSMPSLSEVGDSAGFYLTSFESFSAPNLTETGQSLVFAGCSSLTNLSFPQLTTIGGGFLVANNTELTTINGFQKLKTVGGAIDFLGVFEKYDSLTPLPTLTDICTVLPLALFPMFAVAPTYSLAVATLDCAMLSTLLLRAALSRVTPAARSTRPTNRLTVVPPARAVPLRPHQALPIRRSSILALL